MILTFSVTINLQLLYRFQLLVYQEQHLQWYTGQQIKNRKKCSKIILCRLQLGILRPSNKITIS